MPKTSNFSDREKRKSIDLLDTHNDINAVHLLTGYPVSLAQKAAPPTKRNFVRKKFFFVRETDNVGKTYNQETTAL